MLSSSDYEICAFIVLAPIIIRGSGGITSIIDPRPVINFIAIEDPADQFGSLGGRGRHWGAGARPGAAGAARRRQCASRRRLPRRRHGRAAPRPLRTAPSRTPRTAAAAHSAPSRRLAASSPPCWAASSCEWRRPGAARLASRPARPPPPGSWRYVGNVVDYENSCHKILADSTLLWTQLRSLCLSGLWLSFSTPECTRNQRSCVAQLTAPMFYRLVLFFHILVL